MPRSVETVLVTGVSAGGVGEQMLKCAAAARYHVIAANDLSDGAEKIVAAVRGAA